VTPSPSAWPHWSVSESLQKSKLSDKCSDSDNESAHSSRGRIRNENSRFLTEIPPTSQCLWVDTTTQQCCGEWVNTMGRGMGSHLDDKHEFSSMKLMSPGLHCQWQGCQRVFADTKTLKKHIKDDHFNVVHLRCSFCGKISPTFRGKQHREICKRNPANKKMINEGKWGRTSIMDLRHQFYNRAKRGVGRTSLMFVQICSQIKISNASCFFTPPVTLDFIESFS
jgi:hypothetical protein